MTELQAKHRAVRHFYDEVYHKNASTAKPIPSHFGSLARKLGISKNQRILDVGCGTGEWLRAAAEQGAIPAGIDISRAAIEVCKELLPGGSFRLGPAEQLPFQDQVFDWVTCMGSLEHFIDQRSALHEMIRVAKQDASFVLLVPNAGFLTRRLGLFRGTQQRDIHEDVRTLKAWGELFESAGLNVVRRWKDLHVLSWSWIRLGPWYGWPLRLAQASALPFWPLSWQYQVYHLCTKTGA